MITKYLLYNLMSVVVMVFTNIEVGPILVFWLPSFLGIFHVFQERGIMLCFALKFGSSGLSWKNPPTFCQGFSSAINAFIFI